MADYVKDKDKMAEIRKTIILFNKEVVKTGPIEIKDEIAFEMRYGFKIERGTLPENVLGPIFNVKKTNANAPFAKDIIVPDKCVCRTIMLDGRFSSVDVKKRLPDKPAKLMGFFGRPDEKGQMRHPTLMRVYACFLSVQKIYLITDIFGTFNTVVAKVNRKMGQPLSENDAQKVLRQVASGVQYLHSVGYCHLNIRGENFLIDTEFNVKMDNLTRLFQYWDTDMETVLKHDKYESSTNIGNLHLPPECFQGPHNPLYVDSFSLGCLIHRLFTNETVFFKKGFRGTEKLDNIFALEMKKRKKPIPEKIITILPLFLGTAKAEDRMTMKSFLESDFLKNAMGTAPAAKEGAKEEEAKEEGKEDAKEDAKEGEEKPASGTGEEKAAE